MTKTKILITGVVIAAVVAAVSIGIAVYTHEEPGFTGDPHFNHTPITVVCDSNDPAESFDCVMLIAVVSEINRAVGHELLTIVNEEGDIDIVAGVPQEVQDSICPQCSLGEYDDISLARAGEYTALYYTEERATRCQILISNAITYSELYFTMYHGIGHCLNLEHDDQSNGISIMVPVDAEQSLDGELSRRRFTDFDIKALRERYFNND